MPGGYDDAYHEGGEIDSRCLPSSPTRLTAGEQQDVAARVLGLAAAAFLRHDPPAGDVLDGRTPIPVAAGVDARVAAVGRGRSTLMHDSGYSGVAQGPMSVEECVGISETEDPGDCGAFTGEGISVHWPEVTRDPVRLTYLDLEWEEPGGSARLDLKAPMDLSRAAGFEARVAVAPVGPPVRFDVTLTDAGGRSATMPAAEALSPYPEGDLTPSRRWGQRIFVAVGDDLGIDLSRVVTVTFTPTTSPVGDGSSISAPFRPSRPPERVVACRKAQIGVRAAGAPGCGQPVGVRGGSKDNLRMREARMHGQDVTDPASSALTPVMVGRPPDHYLAGWTLGRSTLRRYLGGLLLILMAWAVGTIAVRLPFWRRAGRI